MKLMEIVADYVEKNNYDGRTTRTPKRRTTMFKPPRPQINKQIIEAAAEVFVRENIDSLPEYLESEDLVEHLVKHFARHKDGFELAKDLECEGWDITAETVQLLDEFDIHIGNALQDAEKEWIKTNNIQPPLESRKGKVLQEFKTQESAAEYAEKIRNEGKANGKPTNTTTSITYLR